MSQGKGGGRKVGVASEGWGSQSESRKEKVVVSNGRSQRMGGDVIPFFICDCHYFFATPPLTPPPLLCLENHLLFENHLNRKKLRSGDGPRARALERHEGEAAAHGRAGEVPSGFSARSGLARSKLGTLKSRPTGDHGSSEELLNVRNRPELRLL